MKYGLSDTERYNLNVSVRALDTYKAEWRRVLESLRDNAKEMHTTLNSAVKIGMIGMSYADKTLHNLHKVMQSSSTFASHNMVALQYGKARDYVGEYGPARHKALLMQGQCLYEYAENVCEELMILCLTYDFDDALRDDAHEVVKADDPDSVYIAVTTLLKGMKRYGDGITI